MAQIDTLPNYLDVGSKEIYPLGVDATAYLTGGVTVSSATATLVDASTGVDFTSTGIASTTLSTNVATIILHNLVAGKTYSLFGLFTLSDASVLETRTTVRCPA